MSDKLFFDKNGYIMAVGDKIMYITDGPRVNYGVIEAIGWKTPAWSNREQLKITVLKTAGGWLEKPTKVTLTYPTVFKCDSPVLYQPKVFK
jgi:hypothetical protein